MKSDFIRNWSSQVKKGALTYIVLKVLVDKKFYGYELIEEVKKHTKIEVAEGTLYPLMNRLKREELVESDWVEQESGIPRKYYSLTNKGAQVLSQMQEYWTDLNESLNRI